MAASRVLRRHGRALPTEPSSAMWGRVADYGRWLAGNGAGRRISTDGLVGGWIASNGLGRARSAHRRFGRARILHWHVGRLDLRAHTLGSERTRKLHPPA